MNSPLQVPALEKTRHLLLETDSKKLTAEIRDMPYADIPSALLIAHRRLYTFNRFALPAAKRFELVRPFHYAFIRFMEHYRRHFEGGAFSRELDPAELDNLLEFLRELGFGFKHLIHDTLGRTKRPAGIGLILYMALNYQHYYALFSYCRGRMLKPSFWKEVHYLYFTACELKQNRSDVETPDGKQVMIEQLYKQIVLLGLVSPYSLSPEDLWRTQDYLARFGNHVAITDAEDDQAVLESYSLYAGCSQPALVPDGRWPGRDNLKVLNLAQFVDNLHRHVEAIKGGESLRIVGMDRLQRRLALDLLQRLYANWTRNPQRKSPRLETHEQIGLVWGLENICTMLDPQMRRRETLNNRTRDTGNRAWAHADNESANGICIRLSSSEDRYPEPGQVLALIRQQNQQKNLEVGLVQWSAIDQDNLPFCGVERFQGTARKVTIVLTDDQNNERNGLLLIAKSPGGQTRTLLLAPAGMLKPGAKAQVYSPIQAGSISLEAFAITHRTRQVETFEIRILQ